MSRLASLARAAAACAVLAGCAHALKEPPPLSQIGGAGPLPGDSEDLDSLLRHAEFLYARRALPEVREATTLFLAAARRDSTRIDGLLGAVKAQTWLADHEGAAPERAAAATAGVQSAQWCMRLQPQSAACEYWLGAAMGLQAREKRSTALDALPRIEQAFRRASEMDPGLEEGGPYRALALLYARAPAWPAGPGDPDRALEEARHALEIAPDYPPNLLALGEALANLEDASGARDAYTRALGQAQERLLREDPDAKEWIEEARKGLAGKSSTP